MSAEANSKSVETRAANSTSASKKLYLVHCGYYDEAAGFGVYEFHTNFFVVAADPQEARTKAKENPQFKAHRMHVDGLVEVNNVAGYAIQLTETVAAEDVRVIKHRDLAPKPAQLAASPETPPI